MPLSRRCREVVTGKVGDNLCLFVTLLMVAIFVVVLFTVCMMVAL